MKLLKPIAKLKKNEQCITEEAKLKGCKRTAKKTCKKIAAKKCGKKSCSKKGELTLFDQPFRQKK